jgi:hypothetical protein
MALGTAVTVGGRAAAAGLWEFNVPGVVEDFDDAQRLQGELDDRLATVQSRIHIKESLVAALAAGHMSLREAGECFRQLQADEHGFWVQIRTAYPGASDEERIYRNVIDFASATLRDQPDHDAVVRRLERELGDYLAAA